ncbi:MULTISPECIES: DUF982 domain-containing protein [unclassified Sinorhizobium]|uniref:DUF982 domain-containing protein n=1 Tax=unclassified Sinorhizobium TaxID=2613772 RepID=UPI0035266DC6
MQTNTKGRFHMNWQVPVRVRVGNGHSETIRGPKDALDYLTNRWPVADGPHYIKARRECMAAIERKVSPDIARDIFIAASIESDMLA